MYDPKSQSQLALIAMLQSLQAVQRKLAEDSEVASGGKAFKQLHRMKRKVFERPVQVVEEHLGDTRLRLGAETQDAWQLWLLTERISWGKMLGLKRVHWYLSHALAHSVRGENEISAAYQATILRALRRRRWREKTGRQGA